MISRVPAILDVKKLKSIDLWFEFGFCISIKQWLDIYGKFLLTIHWNYFFHELLYLSSLSAPSERIHLLPVEFEHANIIYILKTAIRENTAQQTQNNSVNQLQLWKNHNKTKEEWVFDCNSALKLAKEGFQYWLDLLMYTFLGYCFI